MSRIDGKFEEVRYSLVSVQFEQFRNSVAFNMSRGPYRVGARLSQADLKRLITELQSFVEEEKVVGYTSNKTEEEIRDYLERFGQVADTLDDNEGPDRDDTGVDGARDALEWILGINSSEGVLELYLEDFERPNM